MKTRTAFATALAGLTVAAGAVSIPAATAGSESHGAKGCEAKLRKTLKTHLDAIENRDLKKLAPTVDESMVLIFPSGSIRRGKDEFMAFHRDWFADPNWAEPTTVKDVNVQGCKTAWTLIDYYYQTLDDDGNVISQSHSMFSLTWTFKRGKWVAIADQNTRLPS